MSDRESLGSRLGFILISVGCAVGLGNVWRFPYIAGKYGGGMFVLLYLLFLAVFGFPILTMELAIGRAGRANLIGSMRKLSGNDKRWVIPTYISFCGNLLLMIYYTTITGWLLAYACKYFSGSIMQVRGKENISGVFAELTGSPLVCGGFMLASVVIGALLCSSGLRSGVEKSVKVMMFMLFLLIAVLAGYALTTPGAAEGMKFYLFPDVGNFTGNIGETVFAAMGQAFFTLSIGVGSMAIFGSYIGRERRLAGESLIIILLDTLIALMAGVIIFPICFTFGIQPDSGPGLIFESLPNIFSKMSGGRWWGCAFFIFLALAALTTVVAVFENLIAFCIDELKLKRPLASLLVGVTVGVLSLPCVFGFSLWKSFQPFGENSNVLDLEDFLMSQNLLPLGSLILVLFCTLNWERFTTEANTGSGLRFPGGLRFYCRWILPLLLLVIFVWGYWDKFGH